MAAGSYPDPRRIGTEVTLARGLEAGGYYNAAKLLWALAYADEIRRSQIGGVPTGEAALEHAIEALQRELEESGAPAEALAYLERGRRALGQRSEMAWVDSGPVAVCRACGHLLVMVIPERCPGCGAWRLTFRQFPSVHFLEPVDAETAVATLEATPGVLAEAMAGLSAKAITTPPAAGEWSMREAVHHFLVTESLLSGRVRQILEHDRPRLAGVAAWAKALDDATAEDMLTRFRGSREETVSRLRGVGADQWLRIGEHEEFGPVTLLQQASYFARHDHSHLGQVEAIRQAVQG
jgi:hypothetical protein